MQILSSPIASNSSRYALTYEELLKGYKLFLGRKPRTKEAKQAIEKFRSVSGMNKAMAESKEFNSWWCRFRLALRPATVELAHIAFELLLRRRPENETIVKQRAEDTRTHLKLLEGFLASSEVQKLAERTRIFSCPMLNATPRIIYLHTPKTAGSSFSQLAEDIYTNRATIKRNGVIDAKELGNASIFGGHFKYFTYEQMTGQRVFLSVVRDPVERAISRFNYYKDQDQKREYRINKKFDHDDMKKTLRESPFREEFINNVQCQHLSGQPRFESVKRAFERDVFIVGHMQNLQAWLQCVAGRLGWPSARLPSINMARSPGYLESFKEDSELMDILREQNKEDLKLYEFIRNQGVYESQGPAFDYSAFRIDRDQVHEAV